MTLADMALATSIAYSGPASPPGGTAPRASRDSGPAIEEPEEPTGVRGGCLLAAALFALGAVLVIALVAFRGGGDGRVGLGSPEGLCPGSVVYHATDHVFVVRLTDGSPVVLSDVDPHNPPGRQTCRVTYRPDLGSDEGGRFFDVCSGAMYDIAGRGLQEDGLDLRPIPFELDAEGQLTIAENEAAFNPSRLGRRAGSIAA